MSESETFQGWTLTGENKQMEWTELKVRPEDDYSVDIDITHCGVCGSDIHTMEGEWGTPLYPLCVGHEIAGICTKVGKKVANVKVGDRIGVGTQSGSCHECDKCKSGLENLCFVKPGRTTTYNDTWPSGDNAYGGYANKWRGDSRFVFKIPEKMTNEVACTFFCAGVTTYAPLKRHGVNEKSVVGIVGVGGLGHYGIMWAKAMGAKVVAISHNKNKMGDCEKLGADNYLALNEKDALSNYTGKLTHILATGFNPEEFQWTTYIPLLTAGGVFINLALPHGTFAFPPLPAFLLTMYQFTICGSIVGSPAEIEDMLEFAVEKDIKPWISKYPMKDALNAIKDFKDGKACYRIILEN